MARPLPPSVRSFRRGLDGFFVALCLLFILSSLGFKASAKWLGWPCWNDFVIYENRLPNRFPDLRTTPAKHWGRDLEAWYNDNFAWRARLIQFYRHVHFQWLKTAVGQQVPGHGAWVFRKQSTWAELDDYLGGFELTGREARDWVDFFEGRTAWAAAHGIVYLQVITSVKAQVMPEKIPAAFRRHRGVSVREQVQTALRGSFAERHVLFTHETLVAAAKDRPVFYEEDHHPNAYGTYLIFRAIAERLGEWLPDMEPIPFYDEPPPEVVAGQAPGCYEVDRRLKVVVPGLRPVDDRIVRRAPPGRFPMVSLATEQPAPDRTVVIGHDSYLRFPLSSWHLKPEPVLMPLAVNFKRLVSLMFVRFALPHLEFIAAEDPPAAIVEQFPEMRLQRQLRDLDATTRKAARFGRGTPRAVWTAETPAPLPAPAGEPFAVLAVLENVTDAHGKWTHMRGDKDTPKIGVDLLADGQRLDTAWVYPGNLRAAFFTAPARPEPAELEVRLRNGKAALRRIEVRTGGPR